MLFLNCFLKLKKKKSINEQILWFYLVLDMYTFHLEHADILYFL